MPLLRPHLDATATALGAAIAGGIGVGLFADFSVAGRLIPVVEAESPMPEHSLRYAALYPLFQQTYTALKPLFDQLTAL
jgi:xylulokinase